MGDFFNKLCGALAAGTVLFVIAFGRHGDRPKSPPPDSSLYEPVGAAGNVGAATDGPETGTGTGTGTPTNGTPPPPYEGGNGEFDSANAIALSDRDNAGSGFCARGVANIAEAQGLGNFRGMDAHDFPNAMASQGWVELEGYTPDNAPPGAILTFNSDVRMGNPPRKSGGGTYGHVEFVATNANGGKTYISDEARPNWGGSVPDNFTGVWVKQ